MSQAYFSCFNAIKNKIWNKHTIATEKSRNIRSEGKRQLNYKTIGNIHCLSDARVKHNVWQRTGCENLRRAPAKYK